MIALESIAEIAERYIAEAKAAPVEKTASAVALHPLAAMFKEAAARLRADDKEGPTLSVDMLQKVAAAQIGTGAQNPSSGAAAGAALPKPTLPSLQTNNLGVTAGTGGAPPTLKVAADLRALAGAFRHREEVRSVHLLKAATAVQHLTKAAHACIRPVAR